MAAPRSKKRKREIQDLNAIFASDSSLCEKSEDQQLSPVSKESDNMVWKEGDISMTTTTCMTITRSAGRSNRSRKSASAAAAASSSSSPLLHHTVFPRRTGTLHRSRHGNGGGGFGGSLGRSNSVVRLKKPLMTLRGSVKARLASSIKKNLMKGKQDYTLPLSATTGQLDYLQFLDAMQTHNKHDEYLQQKMDYEIKMRDGTAKLLAASRHPHQMLEAAKNLLTSNTRMLAYMSELQTRKTEEVMRKTNHTECLPKTPTHQPCKAKLAVSDIRIPLMWKDGEHYHSKKSTSAAGGHFAVFCMLTIGTEIYDTVLLKDVDTCMTDVCFEDVIVFSDIPSDFSMKLEVYCHKLDNDDYTSASSSTPRRIKKRFSHISNSVGRSVGKRLSGLKDDPEFMANMLVGPKFECIGSGTLSLSDVSDYVQTFDLTKSGSGELLLPLFGNICCRLAAQPHCLLHTTHAGMLKVATNKGRVGEYWCELKRCQISCWQKQEHSTINSNQPAKIIPITKFAELSIHGDHVRIKEREGGQDVMYSVTPCDQIELETWHKALTQHILDQEHWRHACDQLMEIKPASPHNVPVFLRKGTSAASEQDSDSPMTRILNRLNVMDPISPLSALPESSNSQSERTSGVQTVGEGTSSGDLQSTARDVFSDIVSAQLDGEEKENVVDSAPALAPTMSPPSTSSAPAPVSSVPSDSLALDAAAPTSPSESTAPSTPNTPAPTAAPMPPDVAPVESNAPSSPESSAVVTPAPTVSDRKNENDEICNADTAMADDAIVEDIQVENIPESTVEIVDTASSNEQSTVDNTVSEMSVNSEAVKDDSVEKMDEGLISNEKSYSDLVEVSSDCNTKTASQTDTLEEACTASENSEVVVEEVGDKDIVQATVETEETESDMKSEIENKIKSETETEVKSEIDNLKKNESENEMKSETETEMKGETDNLAKNESKNEMKCETENEMKCETENELKSETRNEVKSESENETKKETESVQEVATGEDSELNGNVEDMSLTENETAVEEKNSSTATDCNEAATCKEGTVSDMQVSDGSPSTEENVEEKNEAMETSDDALATEAVNDELHVSIENSVIQTSSQDTAGVETDA